MSRRLVSVARIEGLLSTDRGLTSAEAEERRRIYGENDILEIAGRPFWELLKDTARDPMIWFLLGTGLLYAILREWTEAATLLVASVPLIGMDAYLHRRTRASTEALRSRLTTRATVIRDGRESTIASADLVPGDLVIVSASEALPADGIFVSGSGLQADESMLTGEAFPVRKRVLNQLPAQGSEAAIDHVHWGFAGTRALTGRALLRVAFTGSETLYGEITRVAVGGGGSRSPMQQAIDNLVAVLVSVAAAVCIVLSLVRLWQGHGWTDALLTGVTLAAAALPEEFPVTFTFFLALGVYRLARQQALVRRAASVESIGGISCICSDKTGTITEGQLALTHLFSATGVSREQLLGFAGIASRHESNDPLDSAILREVEAQQPIHESPEVIETFPFTEDSRRETAIVRDENGAVFAVTKGSPEVILPMTRISDVTRSQCDAHIATLAQSGHKVIACAWQALDGTGWAGNEPPGGYHLAGLLAFEDPVRDGVAAAIAECAKAGVRVVMVTGDHPLTARSVAREIGLGNGKPAVACADDLKEKNSLEKVDVIARAMPSQKLHLVKALQSAGEIVAVTGDGVNDVPALQAADVGIAMGERGTRSAREVASIVLLDDNFRTIVRAIGEGRQLFRNLQVSFAYLLMIHLPLVLSALLIPLIGEPVLYLPIHLVWLEMIIHPTALLAFQDIPAGGGPRTRRQPRPTRFFTTAEWAGIVAIGTLTAIVVVAGYLRSLGDGGQVEHARAMALAQLTFASAGFTIGLSELRGWPARVLVAATVLSAVVLVQAPALSGLLHLSPLHWHDWIPATGCLFALAALCIGFSLGIRRRDR